MAHHILGTASQNATNTASTRGLAPGVDRAEFLDTESTASKKLDPDEYPLARVVADRMRDHGDREQFLTEIDLVLVGVTAVHPPGGRADRPTGAGAGRGRGASAGN